MVKKLLIFLVSLTPATVMAGFQVVEEPPRPAPTAVTGASSASSASVQAPKSAGGMQLVALTYIGEPDADIPVISGFGRDLKLSEAIKQIVPVGWHAFLKEDMATRAGKFGPVNWKGGRRWIEVLDIFANDQNLVIDVDWTKKHLYVGEKQLSTAANNVKNAKQEKWSFRAGDKISDVVSIWCKTNGWTLAWDAQEIVAEVDVTVDGQFEMVVEMIVDALNRGGAGIRAIFYDANRVLRITEKKQ